MPDVTLILPSLSLADDPSLADRAREFPRLAALLGRARCTPREGPPETATLAVLGLPADTGIAALTAAHDFGAEIAVADLLRSDPIYLHADPNRVLVYAPSQLEVSAAEADELLQALDREFPELVARRGAVPARWYVRRPSDVSGVAPSVDWLHGRSMTPFMPLDAATRAWRRWLNDVQMLLHDQPVNIARSARGLPPLNGVWWYGAGARPVTAGTDTPGVAPAMFGNDVLLAGAARATGGTWRVRATPADLLGAARARGHAVLVAGAAFGAAEEGTHVTLGDLETRWLPPLISALHTRRIGSLRFVLATHHAHVGWLDSFKTWCRPRCMTIA
ncbi:MAG: hypothetical protein AB7O21_00605 [Gammaproteobacteria bacterium]